MQKLCSNRFQSSLNNSALVFTLLIFLVFLQLPISQEMNNAENTNNGKNISFQFKQAMSAGLFESQKKESDSDVEKLKQSDWYSSVMKNLEQSEYRFAKVDSAGRYSAPNRKNNLRFYYDENGFSVEPRSTKIPVGNVDAAENPDQIKYENIPNWKVSFLLDKKQVGKGEWQIDGNKAEYKTDNITVQYINNDEGMRQNFIVQKPLSADKNLNLNFSVKTSLKHSFSQDQLQFVHDKSGAVLNYEGLKVWDAGGNILAAAFERDGNDYSIHVNTTNAVYPITIDPINATPTVLEKNQASAFFGASVASAGDVNGDGYSDVIVGAFTYDNGQANEGAAFIYYGSATGINIATSATLEKNQVSAAMGVSVASAGDVNGDGYSDVIVGASGFDNGQTDEGAAFIYHGSAAGINTTSAATLERNQTSAFIGRSVASAGDVNGDGYSDVIVGASSFDNGQTDEGAAFIYYGSATGINTATAATLEKNQASANLGNSVASAGDVNGDGYSDVIVGAELYDNGETDEGAAFIYHGSASGINTTSAATLEMNQVDARVGGCVASAGDVNGDGYSDVIVGAELGDNSQSNEGIVQIYHGSASGINTSFATRLEKNQADADFGTSVACAGDINGDGYSDVIVGADLYEISQTNEGAAFIYHGSASGINPTVTYTIYGAQANANMGTVASAGDVNGDGYSDVIIGAFRYDNPDTDEGVALIYHGSASGTNTTFATRLEKDQSFGQIGVSIASAGDVNGDSYSDVIVGAQYFDNGETDEGAAFIYHGSATGIGTTPVATVESDQVSAKMGGSVSSAGDVNGDGYSDVIVGALFYDGGQTDEGAAFIYRGSATGIVISSAVRIESNLPNILFGSSVASAGDVNGDGYSDVIVGALLYSNNESFEGAAYIYRGSATGISTSFAARVESNQANAYLGWSVAGAGDVNGDGYSDIIVGAYQYDNGQTDEGAAFIYHGSPAGISTGFAVRLEYDNAGAQMGISVASAGDVNGDGYSDVIVGAQSFSNGQTNEGAALIYRGSGTGIVASSVVRVESNQSNAAMGYSVASAGDVNGDGYSDVIVGAYLYDAGQTDEGAAFIYHGSASGISTTFAARIESQQVDAKMGVSVACAGDVNGDGYSDVIAGAYLYDAGQTDEGAVFVYYGNASTNNKRNNLDLYNTDLITPVSAASWGAPNFGTGLFAKSFLGRVNGKLVWETKVNYIPYNGNPITNSVSYTSQQNVYTNLGLSGALLKSPVAKETGGRHTKIRARVKYNPATAITGQMYGPWRYIPEQITGQSMGVLPVDIISFNAVWVQQGKTAQINFTTDNETAICCYEIEKSSDGFNFIKIARLTATNTSAPHAYQFIDNNATGKKQYYRLKTIHNDGAIDYSNIQLLQHNAATEILVFPNPATDELQLRLNGVYSKMNVQIVNNAGQTVKQFTAMPAANQTIKIPISNLASGMYFLYLQSGEEKQVLQFVKK